MTDDQHEALIELEELMCELHDLKQTARQLVADNFPEELPSAEAYDIFNFGSSVNPYDTTLEKLVGRLAENN